MAPERRPPPRIGRRIAPWTTEPPLRFVTASLKVDYLRPTPLGVPLEVRGAVEEIKERKVVVRASVSANGQVCATGRVVAVRMPEGMIASLGGGADT